MINLMLEFLYTGKVNIETSAPKSPFFFQTQNIKIEPGSACDGKPVSFNPFTRAITPNSSCVFSSAPITTLFSNGSSPNTHQTSLFGGRSSITPPQQFGAFGAPSVSPNTNTPSAPATFGTTMSGWPKPAASTPLTGINTPTYAKELPRLARLYITAEKYNIQPLKDQVRTKFRDTLPETSLSSYFIESLEIIFDAIPQTCPPDPLRAIALKAAGQNARFLFANQEFVFLCKDNGEFATQILQVSLGLGQ